MAVEAGFSAVFAFVVLFLAARGATAACCLAFTGGFAGVLSAFAAAATVFAGTGLVATAFPGACFFDVATGCSGDFGALEAAGFATALAVVCLVTFCGAGVAVFCAAGALFLAGVVTAFAVAFAGVVLLTAFGV